MIFNAKTETVKEKADRIFRCYKKDLIRLSNTNDGLRFICIEYVCSFPKINPYEMAATLIKDGIKVIYDDSSISKADNIRKERKVNKLLV